MIRKIAMFKHFPLKNFFLLVSSSLLAFQLQAGSDTFIDFEATIGADDNVTRAADNFDIEHDAFFTLAGTVGQILLVNKSGILKGKILLEANKFARFDGLSNVVAAGKINYTFGFGSGFGVPWFSLEADYGVVEFESFLRDSNIGRATATMGMQIDDSTTARLGFSYQNRDAESKVFDTENTSFFVNLDWEVVRKHIVYATYKYDEGDIFSSATDVEVYVIDASSGNIVEDDVFIGKRTYRVDGTTQFVTLGYNMIRNLDSSFDFSARYLESEAKDVDLTYSGLTLRASYFHRFNL